MKAKPFRSWRLPASFVVCTAIVFGVWTEAFSLPRIVGGEEVAEEEFPWMALVAEAGESNLRRAQITTAALIHPRFVLTSAHAVRERTGEALDVLFDAPDLRRSAGKRVAVVDVVIHPGFVEEDGLYRNDMALLRLAEAVTDRVPLPVIGDAGLEAPGAMLTVAGWATSSRTGSQEGSSRLRADMPVLASEEANGLGAFAGKLDDPAFLPLGIGDGSADGCPEEGSFPVLAWLEDAPVLAGLVSFGDECGEEDGVRVSTRLRLMQPWIDGMFLPGYGAWAESRRLSGGPWGDADGNGASNLSDYALSALTATGIRLGTADQGGTLYTTLRFRGPRGLSSEALGAGAYSADLHSWTGTDLLGVEPVPGSPGQEEWTFKGLEAGTDSGFGFLRFQFEPGTDFVPAKKPVWFASDWPVENLLSEEKLDPARPGGAYRVRDYALLGLPLDRPATVRVRSEDFAPAIWVLREDTGQTVGSSPGSEGRISASVDFQAEAGRSYLARVGTYLPDALGEYGFFLRESEGPPAIGAATTPIVVEGVEGTNPAAVTFDVTNTGGGFLDFTVTSPDSWIVVQTPAGGLESDEDLRVRIGFNVDGLGYGTFLGSVIIDGGQAGQVTVPVELRLLPDLPHVTALHQGIYSLDVTDPPNPLRTGEYMDEYLFTTSQPGTYQVSMTSAFIDTYLYLWDFVTGELLVEVDDNQAVGSVWDATFGVTLPAGGSYIITASCYGSWSLFPRNTGSYGLTVAKIQ